MKSKIITVCIVIVIIALTIILAVNVNEQKDSKFNIVTSFYPMYIATLNITDEVDNVSVTNLTGEINGCIHDYVLTTAELVTLAKADVLVINGAGMEGFMDKVISNFDSLKIIDASDGIEIIHEECNEEHEERDAHEGHNHETNPHVFVSIKNYIKQVRNICEALVEKDSANKQKYEENTKAYISKLEELDQDMMEVVSTLSNRNIVTFHNMFEYFAKDYGLNVVGTVENEHGKNPSAGEIASLVESIKKNNVRAIFVEPDYNLKLVDTISKETGIKVYMLNPTTSGKDNKDEYINIMKQNMNELKEALS